MYALRKPIQLPTETKLFNVYEANIDPMLRFCHVQNVETAGWVTIKNPKQCLFRETFCDEEYTCEWKNILPCDKQNIAPIVQASFDIETYSADGSFPDPNDDQCPVIQIATTLQRWWCRRQADVVASVQNNSTVARDMCRKRVKESPVMRCSESGDEVWVRSIDDDDENPDHIEDQIPLDSLF